MVTSNQCVHPWFNFILIDCDKSKHDRRANYRKRGSKPSNLIPEKEIIFVKKWMNITATFENLWLKFSLLWISFSMCVNRPCWFFFPSLSCIMLRPCRLLQNKSHISARYFGCELDSATFVLIVLSVSWSRFYDGSLFQPLSLGYLQHSWIIWHADAMSWLVFILA